MSIWLMGALARAAPAGASVDVGDPYANPSVAPASSAFLSLRNRDSVPHALVAASSSVAAAVEIHTMTVAPDGTMQMRPVHQVDLPPGGGATLSPDGTHLMLIGLHAPLTAGAVVDLVLTFEDGTTAAVKAPVRAR